MIGAHFFGEQFTVMLKRKSARHFQRCPKFVFRAGCDGIGRAQNNMTGEWVALRHVVEGGLDFFRRDFPGDQRTVREIRGKQGLPHAPNSSRAQHGRDPLHHGRYWHTGAPRDFLERLANEALDLVLGDREDFRVDRIVVFDRQHQPNMKHGPQGRGYNHLRLRRKRRREFEKRNQREGVFSQS